MKREEVEKVFEIDKIFVMYSPIYNKNQLDFGAFGKVPLPWTFTRVTPKHQGNWRFILQRKADPGRVAFEGTPHFNKKGYFTVVAPTSDNAVYDFVFELPS